ncbi:hypothetical protein GLOIN_2v1488560, partial [Rhizophagus irregularis DAOM 181602=DAOM 197198]
DKDYFLYYQNLIQCIKNILAIPDITQNYALSYENFEYNGESIYGEQNTGKWQYPIWHRNKQNAKQLLGYLPILEAANKDLIKRQAISIRMSQHSVNPAKTPRTCKFSARLFEFSLQDANTFFNEKKNSVDNKMQTSFARFIGYLDSYLDLLDGFTIIGKTQINIYGSVTLENGAIMRDTNRYHNKVWFSDIAISMDSEESNDYISDKGLCYGQVLLLAEVLTDQPLNLALIQWYDFKSKRNPYLYGCPHLKLIELYNFVAIESIHGIIHIVPRFDKQNEYFVNKYIF